MGKKDNKKKLAIIWLAGFFLLAIDQITKWLAYHFIPAMDQIPYLYPYYGIPIFQNFIGIDFSLNYVINKGAAWGLLSEYQLPLVIFRILLILAMVIHLVYSFYSPVWQFPFMLIIMGASSNVLDFFIYGHVVDMLHFVFWGYEFPVFNLADSAITSGMSFLFILSWLHSCKRSHHVLP